MLPSLWLMMSENYYPIFYLGGTSQFTNPGNTGTAHPPYQHQPYHHHQQSYDPRQSYHHQAAEEQQQGGGGAVSGGEGEMDTLSLTNFLWKEEIQTQPIIKTTSSSVANNNPIIITHPRVVYLKDHPTNYPEKGGGGGGEGRRFDPLLQILPHHNNNTTSSNYFELPSPDDRQVPSYPMPKEHPCEGLPNNINRKECRVASGHLHRANYPTCNTFHELDLIRHLTTTTTTTTTQQTTTTMTTHAAAAKLIGIGGKRLVWKVQQDNYGSSRTTKSVQQHVGNNTTTTSRAFSNQQQQQQQQQPIALKMFKYRKDRDDDFGPLALEYQKRDAIMHMAGSASPYIVDIYGYCGASAINEYGDGGELQYNIDTIMNKRRKGSSNNTDGSTSQNQFPPVVLRGEKLLSTAYEISAGLRDFHTIGIQSKHHPPALAHADIYGNQWVKVNGRYKLTDFNLAKFLVRNRTTYENFPFRREVIDNWFAPEVHRQIDTKQNIVTEKMDIWGLGNVLYLILTGTKPFQGMNRHKVHKLLMERKVLKPPIPNEIRTMANLKKTSSSSSGEMFAQRTLVDIIDQCMMEDPTKRPTSRQVATYLRNALLKLRNYNNLQEFDSRSERFPSIDERVKRYMSSWYTLPCPNDPNAHIRYQVIDGPHHSDKKTGTKTKQNKKTKKHRSSGGNSGITTILFQGLEEYDHIVKIQAKMQTDDAMILEQHMLDPKNMKNNHAGYRADIIETVVPFWKEALGDTTPLLTQWGDKTTFVVSDLLRLDERHKPINLPHLKKCRRNLSKDQFEGMIHGTLCRRGSRRVITTSAGASKTNQRRHGKNGGRGVVYYELSDGQDDSHDAFGVPLVSSTPQEEELSGGTNSNEGGTRTTTTTTMQPIIWKLDSHRLLGLVSEVPKNDRLWHEKKDMGIFRGRLTGNALRADRSVVYRDQVTEVEYCDLLDRCRLVRRHGNSTLVDAKVIEMRHKPLNLTIGGAPLLGNKMTMKEFLKYKVLIVLEGNDIPSGLGWSLRSNSVVAMPPPTWSSWLMEELLQPWVHYVPLDPSLTDVEAKIQWILDNEEEAKRISHRASLWMKDLLEHPDSQKDNDEIFRRMLHRYRQHFLYSDDLLKQYEMQVEAPTRPPKVKPRKTFVVTH